MSDHPRSEGRAAIIGSVRTPLGFFSLVALVLDGVLIVVGSATNRVPLWAPLVVLALLVTGVFAVVLIKPLALYHPSDWPRSLATVTVALVFPVPVVEVDLDPDRCVLKVRDLRGRPKFQVQPNLTLGHGGWALKLTDDVDSADSVLLELADHGGRRWKAGPFAVYEKEAQVNPVL